MIGINHLYNFVGSNEVELTFLDGQLCCFFWSQVLITQSFEWELITSLISFQKRVSPDEIGVKREEYMRTVERTTEVVFMILTGYNVVFHAVKGTLYFLNAGGRHSDISENWYFDKNIWNALFVFSLAFLILFTGMRLLSVSKKHHVTAYRTHST